MRPFALLLFLLASAPALSAPAELKPTSRIEAVTVYRSSARVIRTLTTDLPVGDVKLVLEGLPLQLLDDSLRVQGKGSARAKVFGVSVEPFHHGKATGVEVRALEEKLEKLSAKDVEWSNQIETARAREQFVLSLKSNYSEERTQNLVIRGIEVKELTAMADFIAAQHAAIASQIRVANQARAELARELQGVRAELAKIQSGANVQTKIVTVELRAERAGSFSLDVSYLVPSASWTPVYDARLETAKQQVTLGLFASVQQSTGENWEGVKLAVSTAQPQRNLYVPELETLYLDPAPVYSRGRDYPSAAPMAAESESMSDSGAAEDEETYSVELPSAAIQQGLLATTLTTPRRESVEGTGKARKAFLASFPLTTEMIRSTAPVLEQQVFLSAKGKNTTALAVLSGSANVFLDDEFLGRVTLPNTPVGGELKLAFGADDRVTVERKVERFHETSGIISKDDVYTYRVRTTLKNLYPHPVTVSALEQLPISRDESIKVKLLEGSTKPSEKENPKKRGVRTYTLTLKPQQEQTLVLEYEVRAPKGKLVAEL